VKRLQRVPDSVRNQYPDIPWRDIAGMRDKLIHDYFNANVEIIWQAVQEDVPQLKMMISAVLREIKNS
jgi:uncharacterized protein with HEPN domain